MAKKSVNNKVNKIHASKQRGAQKQGREKVPDLLKSPGRKIHEKKLTKREKQAAEGIKQRSRGNKPRNGCAPKVFMLLLLFTAIGTYLFLGL